jgi:carboxylate-amine ligase
VLQALLDHVSDALADTGDLDRARAGVAESLARGNGARVQRDVMARTGSLRDVVAECVRRTQGH